MVTRYNVILKYFIFISFLIIGHSSYNQEVSRVDYETFKTENSDIKSLQNKIKNKEVMIIEQRNYTNLLINKIDSIRLINNPDIDFSILIFDHFIAFNHLKSEEIKLFELNQTLLFLEKESSITEFKSLVNDFKTIRDEEHERVLRVAKKIYRSITNEHVRRLLDSYVERVNK